jgi:hypothetical protein
MWTNSCYIPWVLLIRLFVHLIYTGKRINENTPFLSEVIFSPNPSTLAKNGDTGTMPALAEQSPPPFFVQFPDLRRIDHQLHRRLVIPKETMRFDPETSVD